MFNSYYIVHIPTFLNPLRRKANGVGSSMTLVVSAALKDSLIVSAALKSSLFSIVSPEIKTWQIMLHQSMGQCQCYYETLVEEYLSVHSL